MARKTLKHSKQRSTSRISSRIGTSHGRLSTTGEQSDVCVGNENQRQFSMNRDASNDNAHTDGSVCLCFLRKGIFLPDSEKMTVTAPKKRQQHSVKDK